jgi:predicted NBD/HSP70 family sugar kinase
MVASAREMWHYPRIMSERIYALADIGATNLRVGVYNDGGDCIGVHDGLTDPKNYEGTVQDIADQVEKIADSRIVNAASVAVAAEINDVGELTKSGALSPWLGRNLKRDVGDALGLPQGLVGANNDVVVIAMSQQHINGQNGEFKDGIDVTLSSGFGGALHTADGFTHSDEPGHEYLRAGSVCPCGGEGHIEAYISGNGVATNRGMSMMDWLSGSPEAAGHLAGDIAVSWANTINRHYKEKGFIAEEFRWTGGVALGQPFIIQRAINIIRTNDMINQHDIVFDTVTMGERAGLHGTFIDAQRRADQF